jgi:fused signal recognition particle receptor
MEIALVILVVLAIVGVALVLRKRKAQAAQELDDHAARTQPVRPVPSSAQRAAQGERSPSPITTDPARAANKTMIAPAAGAAPAVEAHAPVPEGAPAAPSVPADGEPEIDDLTRRESEEVHLEGFDVVSPPPAPVRGSSGSGAPSAEAEAGAPPITPRQSARIEGGERIAARGASFLGLRKGLAKSRDSAGFFGRIKQLLGGQKEIDPELAQRLEEILLGSDVGMATTERILGRLKEALSRGELGDESRVLEALRSEAERTLSFAGSSGAIQAHHQPTVVLFVGVNGAGKTTTIGKLAQQLSGQGKKVMLAAGDTFRAAAVEQLKVWGRRVNCEVVTGKEGADPSSVLFDAIQAAKAARVDVLLADTAGRLHTKTNLMQEMTKVQKVAAKALEGAPHDTLLVIDATNGQNALAQAREFKEALPVTGLVLTKLDGTAKGGVVLGICDALRIPVRYVGVGERAEDLHEFDPSAFVEALLGSENEVIAA